jgi:predicted nucleotidyltransferase
MLFGSAGRGTMHERSDVDVAVAFEDVRPTDDEYSRVYVALLSAVDDALSADVDVVDVHSMTPQFARAAFENGTVVVGSEEQRVELADELAGAATSVDDARCRVAAAVNRLHDDRSPGVS